MNERAERFARAHARLRTVAVTGTNGKTTTTTMIAAIVAASLEPEARLTTVGAWVAGERIVAPTPEDEFLATVEAAVAAGVTTLALETTSKALVYGLAARWRPHVAILTNLSADHLEAHGSPEAYLAAKAQLFMALPPGGVAVLNADDPASELVAEVIPDGVRRLWFSVAGTAADLSARAVEASTEGTRITLADSPMAAALSGVLELRAIGAVHAANALAAALATLACGYAPAAVRRGLADFAGVPGRFEIVGRAPLVIVDYAHTPDGLEGTLATARGLLPAGGELVCVFGCGGMRDRAKRPEMGAIAGRCADVVWLTSDNPRIEEPAAIVAAIRAGMHGGRAAIHEALDRGRAIEAAIRGAGRDDVVVIAGKGHETTQELRDGTIPFSDVEAARFVLASLDS